MGLDSAWRMRYARTVMAEQKWILRCAQNDRKLCQGCGEKKILRLCRRIFFSPQPNVIM